MKIPRGATTFCPEPAEMLPGFFHGASIRHTFRLSGTQDWLLIYTLAGGGLYAFPGGTHGTRAHEVTLYRPGSFQDYRIDPALGKWDLFYAHFQPKPEWLPLLRWPELAPGLMRLLLAGSDLRQHIVRRLRDVDRLAYGAWAKKRDLARNALEEVLLWCDTINPRQDSARVDPRISRAIDHLTARVREPFSEEQLARAAGLSASRLRYLFRQQMNTSPRRFLEEHRLRRARDLLAMSSRTISEIAEELGFASPFYFTLRFKKETGESPRAYRQRLTAAASPAGK